jgi:hypothetical protein
MRAIVYHVSIPAMSTVGFGYGLDAASGDEVRFVGDHRAMRGLGEALHSAAAVIEVNVEEWQIISISHSEVKKPKRSPI